ncbi:hypothetical protein PAECIP111892_00736 [Paenibacillus auburnensis]|uniref:Uncharacterized protein n=1 Tax=Paenibacillus auburnensis TaxID=2905649 RepID=A0ABM9BPH3_9BACL|nr:hypothetical protein [Paenibacillus auburnensis]CAH1191762.1 hypothetical protein PAECIP111892_00736 [Paenibacillus auburnensis]
MNEWLQNIGLFSMVLALLYTIKKGFNYYDLKGIGDYEDVEITRQVEEAVQSLPSRKS